MTNAKALITLFFVVVLTSVSRGQYYWGDKQEIATDYNTCLEGIKDSLGNWIVQPQYENIEEYDERYIVQAGGKFGLLNRSGKTLVPLKWDLLKGVDNWYVGLSDCYHVMLNGKWGVCDTNNRMIVPVEYLYVSAYYDSSFIAKKSKKSYDFYHFNGDRFECPWKQKKQPWHDGRHTFIMKRRTLTGYKYGMVNDSGRVIFERKYAYISAYGSTGVYKIDKGKKFGYCSAAGKMYWPIVFSRPENQSYSYEAERSIADYGIGPVHKNGKWGLITLYGKTVLPFEYNHIEPFDEYSIPTLWKVESDTLSGVYDIHKGWLLQPTCSQMFSVNSYANDRDSSVTVLLIANQGGKWGAMTSAGQSIIPFECDDMLMESRYCYVFQKGDSLLALSLTTFNGIQYFRQGISGIEPILWLNFEYEEYGLSQGEMPTNNQFSLFRGKNGVRAYYNPAETKDTIFDDSTYFVISQGKYYGMSVPDSIVVSSAFAVIPIIKPSLDHEQFDFYGEVYITDDDSTVHSNGFCVMRNHAQIRLTDIDESVYTSGEVHYYITDNDDLLKTTGEIILDGDTIYSLEDERHFNDGSLYFTHYRYNPRFEMCAYDTNGRIILPYSSLGFEEFSDKYTWTSGPGKYDDACQLIDNKTRQNVLGNKIYSNDAYPIWDSITIVETKKNGVRLFNIKTRKYFTTFGFDEIVPLRKDGTLFAVKTCSRNLGVVDASGKVILDTIYTALTTIRPSEYLYSSSGFRSDFYDQFYRDILFYNDTLSVHLEVATPKLTTHSEYIEDIWQYSTIGIRTDQVEHLLRDSFYVYRDYLRTISVFMTEEDSASMLPWQKVCIVDSMYTPMREIWRYWGYSSYKCEYCRSGQWSYGIDWSKHAHDSYYHLVSYSSDSLLCFNRFESSGYLADIEKESFSTIMMFKDGPHQMTLDSLFNPTSDWRNFIINTLISYVNNHTGIEGDCHNPAGIPLMLNEYFELTPAGLLLYPKGFEENNNQLVLTVPWKDVDPYLRKDIKSRLPINQK